MQNCLPACLGPALEEPAQGVTCWVLPAGWVLVPERAGDCANANQPLGQRGEEHIAQVGKESEWGQKVQQPALGGGGRSGWVVCPRTCSRALPR